MQNIVKKGLTGKFKTGKLRYRCKDCKRTSVSDGHSWFVPDTVKVYIDKSLRTSLCGICRIFGVSLACLMADELWSFVFRRKNVKYIWIALHTQTRQIIALYIGDRSRESAKKLWEKIPTKLRETCYFHTGNWESYKTVIPEDRHEYSKIKKYINHIERFNNTLRQRCSRLVRETLSFSNGATIRKLENHIGAINFFCFHYNLTLNAAT